MTTFYVACRYTDTDDVAFMFSVREEPPAFREGDLQTIIQELKKTDTIKESPICSNIPPEDVYGDDDHLWNLALSFNMFPCITIEPDSKMKRDRFGIYCEKWKWTLAPGNP